VRLLRVPQPRPPCQDKSIPTFTYPYANPLTALLYPPFNGAYREAVGGYRNICTSLRSPALSYDGQQKSPSSEGLRWDGKGYRFHAGSGRNLRTQWQDSSQSAWNTRADMVGVPARAFRIFSRVGMSSRSETSIRRAGRNGDWHVASGQLQANIGDSPEEFGRGAAHSPRSERLASATEALRRLTATQPPLEIGLALGERDPVVEQIPGLGLNRLCPSLLVEGDDVDAIRGEHTLVIARVVSRLTSSFEGNEIGSAIADELGSGADDFLRLYSEDLDGWRRARLANGIEPRASKNGDVTGRSRCQVFSPADASGSSP